MKRIIESVAKNGRSFYVINNNKKELYYLTNKLATIFSPILKEGLVVEFKVFERYKKIDNRKGQMVDHFIFIKDLETDRVLYNLNDLRSDMQDVIINNEYYLFIDFEMTMPSFGRRGRYVPEIIQAGFVLTNQKLEEINTNNMYIYPDDVSKVNKRTLKFINVNREEYLDKALSYLEFYHKLKNIINSYHPKLVVWGKNDVKVLNSSYVINNLEPITKDIDFIDLLQLHKDYYNYRDDVGLFKMYEKYYDEELEQSHNAKEDAKITRLIFKSFLEQMNNDLK